MEKTQGQLWDLGAGEGGQGGTATLHGVLPGLGCAGTTKGGVAFLIAFGTSAQGNPSSPQLPQGGGPGFWAGETA